MALAESPTDASKLIIAYESNTLVQWDIRAKAADRRFATPHTVRPQLFRCQLPGHRPSQKITNLAWAGDGKTFYCCHTDSTVTRQGHCLGHVNVYMTPFSGGIPRTRARPRPLLV